MTTYLGDLQAHLRTALTDSPQVFLIGEDLADPYGGAFKVSKGLSTDFPDRVLSTPICEAGITGLAAGMAIRGLRPVVEIMFGDFLTLCADQIVNHICKFSGMYQGVSVPLVIRTPMGGGRGYGATHSQSIEKMFLGIPNLRVVAPSHVHSPGALLQHAILQDDNPVLFIENKLSYPLRLAQSNEKLRIELISEIAGYPTAVVRNSGAKNADVIVISYGGMSRLLLPLMENLAEEEVNVCCLLPSSLRPIPIETIVRHISLGAKVILVEEGTQGFNWGSEVAAQIYERAFDKLDIPIRRLASDDRIIPSAADLEDEMLVTAQKIEDLIFEVIA